MNCEGIHLNATALNETVNVNDGQDKAFHTAL